MYAIMVANGKQYRVEPGTVLDLDHVNAEAGAVVTMDNSVLLVHDDAGIKVGSPTVPGAAVDFEIIKHLRGPKLVIFKMKRRKRSRRKNGFRAAVTQVKVKDIRVG